MFDMEMSHQPTGKGMYARFERCSTKLPPDIERPHNALCNTTCFNAPNYCPNKLIKFYLYKKEGDPIVLTAADVDKGTIAEGKELKVIIHGFASNFMEFPNDIIRPKYLKNPNINVISVDYSLLVHQECLANAPNNLKYVANCTAQLIDALVNKTIDKNKIHLIGFDFGAQVAGQVSNFLSSGKVHRITGLDPSLPHFFQFEEHERLDASDAEFVDVIHSNGGWKGVAEPCGHVDFYVNNGFAQPDCIIKDRPCDHNRAAEVFAESITSEKGFWAHKCKCFVPPKPPLGPPPIRTTEAPTNDTTPPKHTCNEWEGWITEYYKPTLKSTPLNMIALDEGTNSSAEAIVTSLRCPFGETEFALIAECPERGPEEEKDLEIMGESASEAARGVYKVRTRFKPPFARGNPSEEKKDKKNG